MSPLSAVILTRNEQQHLPACLASVRWADEVLVVDSFSTDRTSQIASEAHIRFVQHEFADYASQRNYALAEAKGDWVLFVDADERVSDELRAEILNLLAMPSERRSAAAGYWIPRQNYIFGAWVRHTGWYPDRQLRLMRRERAQYDLSRPVHELVQLDGATGILAGHLIHLNYETVGEFLRKQRQYAVLDAESLRLKGVRARPHGFVLQPLREFRRRYLSLEGYQDGWRGLLLSALMAWYNFEVYRRLADRQTEAGE